MKFPWFKNKDQESKGVRLYLSDGTEVSGRSIAWLEARVAESKAMQDRLTEALAQSNKDIDGAISTITMMRESAATMELALRIAHAFLRQNSAPPSQAFNVTAMISKAMGGRTELAGFEHSEYAKVVYNGATKLTTDR